MSKLTTLEEFLTDIEQFTKKIENLSFKDVALRGSQVTETMVDLWEKAIDVKNLISECLQQGTEG